MDRRHIVSSQRIQGYSGRPPASRIALLLLLILFLFPNLPSEAHASRAVAAAYSVSGTVFDDYNQNGIQDNTASMIEPGINGVVVTAYNAAGTAVTSATTNTVANALGKYTLAIPAGTGPVRIQFSNFGATSTIPQLVGFQPSNHLGGTTVAFVDGTQPTNTVGLGIERPSEYCQNNPAMATSCYLRGDQNVVGAHVIVRFPYNSTGTETTNPPTPLANDTEVGATWGLSYRRSSDDLFAASYTKQLVGYKPGGSTGAIYIIEGAAGSTPMVDTSPFIDLNTLFGTNTAGANPHTATNNYVPDLSTYDAVGKTALGGLALSEDESTLYAMNLADRSLYSIPIGAPPAAPVAPSAGNITVTPVPIPADCTTAGDLRPFAVTVYENLVYVGAVCSAESTITTSLPKGDPTHLKAYVFTYTPGTGFNSTPVFEMPLNYTRHCADGAFNHADTCITTSSALWHPWQPLSTKTYPSTIYPQPMFTSMAFDHGDLIIGLRDRYGDQTGHSISGVPEARTAGDDLRACLNTPGDLSSGWILENNGTCGNITITAGQNNGKGPGNGQYYYTQYYSPYHDYTGVGGVFQVPGFPGVIRVGYDPGTTVFTGGVRTYSNTAGNTINNYEIYNSSLAPTTFGKANGLGSLAALCQSAPIEIGNRVWADTNANGIQDAGEPGIAGVTVHLYAANGTTLLLTTTTDSTGAYYFPISSYTNYVVKLDNPSDYASGGALHAFRLTNANQDTSTHLIDSKASVALPANPIGTGNYPTIAIGSHTPGQNDDSFDVGLIPPPDLSLAKAVALSTSNLALAAIPSASSTLESGRRTLNAINNGVLTSTDSSMGWSSNATLTSNHTEWVQLGRILLSRQTANSSRINQIKPKQPALMLTRTNLPDTITRGKHAIKYVLSVSNGHFAGPVAAGNTITISNIIPGGVTGLTTHAKKSDWKVQLVSKTGPTILTATYIGSYPVLAGASLSPIIVHGTLEQSNNHHLLLPAVVRLLYTNNQKNSSATILQQQSAHAFTVTGGIRPKKVPSNRTTPKKVPSNRTTPKGITPQNSVPTYQPGQTIVYTLSITNDSAAGPVLPGDSITVTDPIPAGLTGITASATTPADWTVSVAGTTSPTTLTATYKGTYPVAAGTTLSPITITGTLTSAALVLPQVTNTAVVVTPNDSNTDNNSGTNIFNIVPLPDLTVTDPVPTGTTGTTFQVGKPVTYTLTGSDLSTAGPVLGNDPITIVDTIPAGLTGITATDSSGNWKLSRSATSGPATLTATYIGNYPVNPGTILPPITVTGTLTSAAITTLANGVTISTPKDNNSTNDTASNSITVIPQPDLTITKTTPKGAIYQIGLPASYTITAHNGTEAGPVLADDPIIITDAIPAGFSGLTATAATPADWAVTLADTTSPTTMTATYKGAYPVATGANFSSITLNGTLTSPSTPQLTNKAVVTTPNDGNTDNNSGSSTIPVFSLPDLTITNPVPPGTTFEVGKPVTYTLTGSDLSTAGPVLGNGPITIVDTIPPGLTGITATDSSGNWKLSRSATSGQATLTATYIGNYPVNPGTILPPITITGTLTSDAMPNLANTATISTPKDINPTNDTAPNSIPVVPQPDLSLSKTIPAAGSLQVGHSVTYAFTVSNDPKAGPILANDPIIVTDTIPTGFKGLTVSANTPADWTVSVADTISPTTMTATYIGSYPVPSGATLSTISLTGTLTAASHPQVINTASVSTPNDGNTDNNGASITSPVLLAPDLSLSKTVTLAPTLTARRQSRGKHLDKAFHAAIGVKNTTQARPSLNLHGSRHPVPTYQGGQQVTYYLTISNNSKAGPVIEGDPVVLIDKIPAGLTNLNATADSAYWRTSLDATTSPATLIAKYVGSYPVLPGARLPTVTLNGILTGNTSQLTNIAQVKTPDDTGATSANGHTGTTTIKVIPAPDMAITKTNFGGHAFYPGQIVQYELQVYSTDTSGPIDQTIPIHVIDTLPRGAYQVKAYGTDWNITIEKGRKGKMIVATYTGPYPLAAGSSLPRIIVDARFRGHDRSSRINTAQVIIPYDKNPDNNTASDAIVIQAPTLPPTGSDPNA